VLFGEVSPSGRLAETIPYRLQDTPSYLNLPGEQGRVRYGEGVMVGYRHHLTAEQPVRYPFGHGLSYSSFSTSIAGVDVVGDDAVAVEVDVLNNGDVRAKFALDLGQRVLTLRGEAFP
jgi:beta-glucosidase